MNVADTLKGLSVLLWLAVIGLFVLAVVRSSRGQKVRATSTTIVILAIAAGVITIISWGVVFIEPEERGVVISAVNTQGYRPEPLEPGVNFIVPGMERVKLYSIARQTFTMSSVAQEGPATTDGSIAARTSDGQEVFVDASVIYQIDPQQVVKVHIDWQDRYQGELVRPLARGVIRDAISQYGVEEVYSLKREEMTNMLEEQMAEQMSENGLKLVSFILRNITFSPEYAASVEQKQIAEQQAQQARFVVDQRKQEAEQARQVAQGKADAAVIEAEGAAQARLIQAQAEAEALAKINEAVNENPDLLQYLYVTKLGPEIEVMLLPSDSPFLIPLPGAQTQSAGGSPATSVTPPTVEGPVPEPSPTAQP